MAVAQAPSSELPVRNSDAVPDINAIVDHVERAAAENRAHYRAYTVTRDYRFYNENSEQPASEVVAQVSFVPPDNKSFEITASSGSSRGEKVVRDLLKAESETAPHPERTALNRENYDFRYVDQESLDGHACYILQLLPKRHETSLVAGRAWIDEATYMPRRVQGDLSKSPSWWLKAIHVTLEFGDVSGMWLQTGSKALAQVRLFGEHTLEARAVRFQAAETVAQKAAPVIPVAHAASPRNLRPTRPLSGTAVFIRH